jgi:hypothetical protein
MRMKFTTKRPRHEAEGREDYANRHDANHPPSDEDHGKIERSAGPRSTAFALFVVSFLTLPASASQTLSISAEPTSGIEVQVSSWYSVIPKSGYAPISVLIHNHNGNSASWLGSSTSGMQFGSESSASTNVTYPVDAHSTGQFTTLAPLIGSNLTSGSSLRISVNGPGIQNSEGQVSNYIVVRQGYLGMSSTLALNSWTPLQEAINKTSGGGPLYGSQLDLATAPSDWRGYTGLGDLWLSEDDWLALEAPARSAMLDWVSIGGRIYLVQNSGSPKPLAQLQLPAANGDEIRHGFGSILLRKWDGHALDITRTPEDIAKPENDFEKPLNSDYQGRWPLRERVGSIRINGTLIMIAVLIFAALVGPVNLFWLARAGQRHRLFWTTPLLTLAATLLFALASIFYDGFGGTGARITAIFLLPGDHKMALLQEQVSKTGILLRSDFATREPFLMLPIKLSTRGERNHLALSESANSRGGWFASRSLQAQLLKTVRSTRGTLSVAWTGNGGTITSSLDVPLTDVFVKDASGRLFKVASLGTGEKQRLTTASETEFQSARDSAVHDAGPVITKSLRNALEQPDIFLARIATPAAVALPTLDSIRWKNDTAICTGPIVTANP